MMKAWRTAAVVVCLCLPASAAGCSVVEQPDAAQWDESAGQALGEAGSNVATARLALQKAADERLWSSYTLVLVTDAEEAMGTVRDDLSRLQVPPERRPEAERVGALLDEADALVRQARSDAVEGRYDDRELLDRMGRTADRLRRLESVETGG